ncbi:hypothetical protein L1049_019087 [Liquidambar formosana]|uniref:DUF7032 domain-containing protein n=1 Tax=Liquidambar formosana TaxID=63359 RepID=A0AAP0RCY0_LIQFO
MVEDGGNEVLVDNESAETCLSRAQELVPVALEKAREVKGFPGRWKMIILKLQQIPSRLSDLSSHPCFSKNALCKEQLQAVSKTLKEAIELADLCVKEKYEGKLRMQSDLDALSGKLDLNLRDCGLLIKTGCSRWGYFADSCSWFFSRAGGCDPLQYKGIACPASDRALGGKAQSS